MLARILTALLLLVPGIASADSLDPRYAGRWRFTWRDVNGEWTAESRVEPAGRFRTHTTGPNGFVLDDEGTITAMNGQVSWKSSIGPGQDAGRYMFDDEGGLVVTNVTGITTRWVRLPDPPPGDTASVPSPASAPVAPASPPSPAATATAGPTGPWVGTWSMEVTLEGKPYIMYMRLEPDLQYRSWALQGEEVLPGASGRYTVADGQLTVEKVDGTRLETNLTIAGSHTIHLRRSGGAPQTWRRVDDSTPTPGEASAGKDLTEADRQDPARCFAEGERLYRMEEMKPAFEWFRRAAALGHARAQLQTGWHCEKGVGTARDLALAADWYRRAAEQGDGQAMANLGQMLELGRGVREDWVSAFGWYAKGAALGDVHAMAALARAHRFGIGTPQDRTLAIQWYAKAGTLGDEECAGDARWLEDRTNNIGFRNPEEKDRVMGGMMPISGALWGADPAGIMFRDSAERDTWIEQLRTHVHESEAEAHRRSAEFFQQYQADKAVKQQAFDSKVQSYESQGMNRQDAERKATQEGY